MGALLDYPGVLFALALVVLFAAARLSRSLFNRTAVESEARSDFGDALAASLTLLGLLIGFTFSMAITRYDTRKSYEEAEANAIGTEFARADLLPAPDAAKVRALLRSYTKQRILFYTSLDEGWLKSIAEERARLQDELWSAILDQARANPTPITSLVVSGMNDVLNAQSYTQAAWWNRIPISAWSLMWLIAIFCNILIGVHARKPSFFLFLVSPLVISTAFFLIADIDSPRGGIIRVSPQNLISTLESMHSK